MKTHTTYNSGLPSCAFLAILLGFVSAALCMIPAASPGGQIFVVNDGNGTIGEYTTSGATVNAALITGLNFPTGIALSGGDLFVVNDVNSTIGEYTTSGATVNAALISGLNFPGDIAFSGADLFVTNENNGTIGEYTTSGATVNPALISGLNFPVGIAIASSVPDASPTSILLLLGVGATFGLNLLLHRRSEA